MTHAGTHDLVLVGLSILIATAASYTALDLAGRIRASSGWAKHAWLATAALAMGGGIWSMHFVAMLAFSMPHMPVDYDVSLTALSFVLPIVVTGVGFHTVNRTPVGFRTLGFSGLVMGLGIVGMHYTGMAAMQMPAALSYDSLWVAISILVAIGASTIALWLAFRDVDHRQKLLASVAMGLAVSGMHYAAMQGAIFTAQEPVNTVHTHASLNQTALALAVSATTFLLLFLSLIAAMFDRRFAHLTEREATALRESEERFRTLYNKTPLPLHSLNSEGIIEYVSDAWLDLLGHRREEVVGCPITDFMTEDSVQRRSESIWSNLLKAGVAKDVEYRLVTKDRRILDVLMSGRVERDARGQFSHVFGGVIDVTARKQAAEARQASEERLRLALHAGRMFAWEHDLTNDFITRSQNSVELLGIGSGPLSDFLERVHPDDRPLREHFPHQTLAKGSDTVEFRYILPDGKMLWLGSRAEIAGRNRIVGVTFDITDRKAAEQEVWRIANHDVLTGLPNRALFQDRLVQALTEAEQNGTNVTLLLIDLDDFKDVNDTLGHDAGDALLKEMATRLLAAVRPCDTVARIGGDEFAVVLAGSLTLDRATSRAETLIAKLRQPFAYAERMVISRASIGVAAFPDHDGNPADLMKDADIALYRAKAQGRNRVVPYSPRLRKATEERVALGREVREAITRDQIVPFYQPKVCLTSGRIIGLEALARWQHPSKGVLTPGFFGAVFDDPELAQAISESLVSKVASNMREWLDQGFELGRVAVNLSSAQFSQPGLAGEILDILKQSNVPPVHFEVEVTETVFLGRSADSVAAILEQFRQGGVQIALDDFGTGFASLTHLKQFPVDHLKVDQTFVRNLERDTGDEAIVTAVIGLGRSFNLQVTAEGVETLGQAKRLKELGCHNAQGYLYARPMAASQVPDLFANWADLSRSDRRISLVENIYRH